MVDIIIPTFNNSSYTVKCLESIARFTDSKKYRVLWIDNGSDEDEAKRVEKVLESSGVPCLSIKLKKNLGFIKAVNVGMAISEGDIVILNNDTEVSEEWLEKLQEKIENGYSLIGPLTSSNCESWQNIKKVSSMKCMKLPAVRGSHHAVSHMVAFFCVYIRREVIQKIGYLCEEYGVGLGDDDEYCLLAIKAGFKIGLALDTLVTHNHRTTFKSIYGEKGYLTMQNERIAHFKAKWGVK